MQQSLEHMQELSAKAQAVHSLLPEFSTLDQRKRLA
jgi:hypothetical protein